MRRIIIALAAVCLVLMAASAWAAVDDEYTFSLLHFDGGLNDENASISWINTGGAIATTTEKKFGTGSLLLDGVDDIFDAGNYLYFEPTAASFTVDFWMRAETIDGSDRYVCGKSKPNSGIGWDIRVQNGCLRVSGINGWAFNIQTAAVIEADKWYHVELGCDAASASIYVNGHAVGSSARGNISTSTNNFRIGSQADFGGAGFAGYIDEFRYSEGIRRHDADFTPPTIAYGETEPEPVTVGGRLYLVEGGRINIGAGGRINFK